MEIILRNTVTRDDAVYALVTAEDDHVLVGYWGRWSSYLDKGLSGLRSQQKAKGECRQIYAELGSILSSKLRKGYEPVEIVDAPDWLLRFIASYGGYPHVVIRDTSKPIPQPELKSEPVEAGEPPELSAPDRNRAKTRAAFLEV
jgi:hypothetical protein